MNIKWKKPDDLNLDETVFISFPLKGKDADAIEVISRDVDDKDALFLNYNIKETFGGVNLYEKLAFIKNVLPLVDKSEIYKRTNLDININPQLLKNLELLLEEEFKEVLVNERVTLKAAQGICRLKQQDRTVLIDLFRKVPFSSSHQLRIIEMVEEILFRDKCALADVFGTLNIHATMEEEKPQRKIIDSFFKHRNPIYWEHEAKWQKEIKELALPANIQVTHYPFFEKRQMELTVRVESIEELKQLITHIEQIDGGSQDEKKTGK